MCISPKYKFLKSENYNKWANVEDFKKHNAIVIKCTKCYECRLYKFYRLLARFKCELKNRNLKQTYIYFITLTYNNENYDKLKNRYYVKNLQSMIKDWRRRNKLKALKYIITSELGTKQQRLHHHALIICDKPFLVKIEGGHKLHNNYYYNNNNIHWKYGFHSISEINTLDKEAIEKTFRYVLKYTLKSPLNILMSKNIGRDFIDKITNDDGFYVLNGYIFSNPWQKKYLTNDEIIQNSIKYNNNKNIVQKVSFWDDNDFKELKKW